MRIFLIISCFLFTISNLSYGQELNANVTVNYQQVQGTNTSKYKTLEKALNEFMNSRAWTNASYDSKEKIDCSFLLTISKVEDEKTYSAKLTVQARRPVYNSNYNSTLINTLDNSVSFTYVEFDVLDFNPNMYRDNLTSIFGFYAYIILGLDNDSYAPNGGAPFFTLAEQVARNAQNRDLSGWDQDLTKQNRWQLIEQLLHPNFSALRDLHYTYYRKGMDLMANAPDLGRAQIVKAIETLPAVHRNNPASMLMRVFFDAHSEEIINLFSPVKPEEKKKIYNILKQVDPSRINAYDKMMQS